MSQFEFETKSSRGDKLLGAKNTETGKKYYFIKLSIGEITYLPSNLGDTDSEGFEKAIDAVKENGYRVNIDPNAHDDAIDPL